MFPFWLDFNPASLMEWTMYGAAASWMFLTYLGGVRA